MTVIEPGGDGWVELSEAIGIVRRQLVAAQLAGRKSVEGEVVVFTVGSVAIEFTGEVTRSGGGGGELTFKVPMVEAKAGARRERSRSATHTVRIELVPQTHNGDPLRVADGVDHPPAE